MTKLPEPLLHNYNKMMVDASYLTAQMKFRYLQSTSHMVQHRGCSAGGSPACFLLLQFSWIRWVHLPWDRPRSREGLGPRGHVVMGVAHSLTSWGRAGTHWRLPGPSGSFKDEMLQPPTSGPTRECFARMSEPSESTSAVRGAEAGFVSALLQDKEDSLQPTRVDLVLQPVLPDRV